VWGRKIKGATRPHVLFECTFIYRVRCYIRVSTTPGNPGNLLEFNWSSWKFLRKMSKIEDIVSSHKIGYQIEKQVAPFHLCYGLMLYKIHIILVFGTLHRRPKQGKVANMSWIFLKIPAGISWKSPGNLLD